MVKNNDKLEELKLKIEEVREELKARVNKDGVSDKGVIELSKKLDELLNCYLLK